MFKKEIDKVLIPWAKDRNLFINTKYKGEEVRSMERIMPNGQRYQIWLESLESDSLMEVKVWDYKKQLETFTTDIQRLEKVLDKAYSRITKWNEDCIMRR